MIKSYRDLIVWQKGMQLVMEVYFLTKKFPQSELCGLANQMKRAAVSIPSNIAEGFARKHRQEYTQFLRVAYASAAELDTQIEISERLKFVSGKDVNKASVW